MTTTDDAARLNAEILAALTQQAEGAVVNGAPPQLHEVISQGEDAFEAPVVSKVFQDAGVDRIYDLRTGAMSLTSRNMLPAQLRKVDDEGRRMFTNIQPGIEPKQGAFKCMLHADERQPEYNQWGLPTCRKSNLASPYEVQQHMEHRHPREWQSIERDRMDREKREEREWQKQIAMAAVPRTASTEDIPNEDMPRKKKAG